MPETNSGILTDVGTNELEVVEFYVDGRSYAINVAKVREIVRPRAAMAVPESHPCVLGVFRNRDDVLPLIDLGRWLGSSAEPDPARAKVVVAEFNMMKIGFLVHGVNRIHRVTWEDLETPGASSLADTGAALGFLRLGKDSDEGERIVFLLDFEGMVAEIAGHGREEAESAGRVGGPAQGRSRVVLIAEDSGIIRRVMCKTLEEGGYRVVPAVNGEEAWTQLDGGLRVDAVISDIEMPKMDGHHLTRRIKGDERFDGIPVVLYSSMIYEEMRVKGEALGADAQLCKPQLPELVGTLDRLLGH